MNTERLIDTLLALMNAKQEEKNERDQYEGNEWGYYGFKFAEAIRIAEEDFNSALEELIDKRVLMILGEMEQNNPNSKKAK